MSIYNTLKGKLHESLHTDFWLQLIEGIAEELEVEKIEKKSKTTLNDLDSTDDEDLTSLATKYGYSPNLILDDSYDFLRKEVKSISYRLKNKTTTNGMLFSFKQANSRAGNLYNTSYDSTGLARLIDQDTTLDNALLQTTSEPFIGIEPESSFYSDGLVYLDESRTLDELPVWTLDQSSTIQTTKHITAEYYLDRLIEDSDTSINYSMTSDYINFMLSEVAYNRRASSIPHVGIQINSIIDDSGDFNYESGDEDYTIPDIELQSGVVNVGTIYNESEDDFIYFVAGLGCKGLPSTSYPTIFDSATLHLPFSDPDSTGIVEDMIGTYECSIVTGNEKRVQGILGKSIDFDTTTYCQVGDFIFKSGDWTLNFWFNVTNETVDNNDQSRSLFATGILEVSFEESTNTLKVYLANSSLSFEEEVDITRGTDYFCQVELDTTNDYLYIYLNTVLEASIDLSTDTEGFSESSYIYIGSGYDDPTDTNTMFNGLIDELSFHQVIFSSDEKSFLYDTKYGDHTYLGNAVYRVALTSTDLLYTTYDSQVFFLLQGIAKANMVTDELLYTSDGSTDTFSTTTKYFPIEEGSITISFTDNTNSATTITDDKNGNLSGDYYSGTIDYDTGECDIDFYKSISLDNVIYASDSITEVSLELETVMTSESFVITYTYDGTTYEGEDNTEGEIIGTNIDSSSIDYDTGIVTITFTEATDADEPVRYDYTYQISQTPDSDTELRIEYQTSNDLEISECGFENSDKKLAQYTCFPPCQFGTTNAFLVNDTIIKVS